MSFGPSRTSGGVAKLEKGEKRPKTTKFGCKSNISRGLQASHWLKGRSQGTCEPDLCDSVIVWSFQDLCGCYKGRKPCRIWLKNQISKGFSYSNLALRGTLAWVLGKNMKCGSGARNISTGGWHWGLSPSIQAREQIKHKNQWIVWDINLIMTLYKSEGGLPKVVDAVELASFIDYKDCIILLLKTWENRFEYFRKSDFVLLVWPGLVSVPSLHWYLGNRR